MSTISSMFTIYCSPEYNTGASLATNFWSCFYWFRPGIGSAQKVKNFTLKNSQGSPIRPHFSWPRPIPKQIFITDETLRCNELTHPRKCRKKVKYGIENQGNVNSFRSVVNAKRQLRQFPYTQNSPSSFSPTMCTSVS